MSRHRLASLTLALTTLPLLAACTVDSGAAGEGTLEDAEQAIGPADMDGEPVAELKNSPPIAQSSCS